MWGESGYAVPFAVFNQKYSVHIPLKGRIKMKRTKKYICILLVCAVMLSSVWTAASEKMSRFTKSQTYTSQFSDIHTDDWFYSDVINTYEYGLTKGADEQHFLPYDLVSVAEVIAFAGRIHSIYSGNGETFDTEDGGSWYDPFVKYAYENGIISENDNFDLLLNKPATRAQNAYILSGSIPFTEFSNINTSVETIPDMAVSDMYYNEIIMLCRAGVISGKDEYATFYPTENVTRAETAAMINRIINPDARIHFTQAIKNSADEQKSQYSAEYVSENASPCVFYIEIYDKDGSTIASGSGFFISPDGTAVTNYHVIDEAYSAKIMNVSGEIYDVAKLLGYDDERDIAIIKINGTGFDYLDIADSSYVKNGQKIFCIGSPLGLDNTISEGVVSNVSRIIDGQEYIQISAPISAGSSGGAVLDTNGRVIGISTGGFTEGQNLNLAIPSNYISTIERDKDLTLISFQNIKREVMTAGVSFFYPDNSDIPDYGYITGSEEAGSYKDSDGSSVARAYVYDSEDLRKYVSELEKAGYSLVSRYSAGFFSNTTYFIFKRERTSMALIVDTSSRSVIISYPSK